MVLKLAAQVCGRLANGELSGFAVRAGDNPGKGFCGEKRLRTRSCQQKQLGDSQDFDRRFGAAGCVEEGAFRIDSRPNKIQKLFHDKSILLQLEQE